MRSLPGLLIALVWVLAASDARARKVQSQPSMYGKFDVIHTQSTCAVSFTLTGKKPRILFTVPDCKAGGLARLSAVESAGESGFPATAASGEELHVFSIATARDGNAVAGDDYWVVIVKRKAVWSARAPLQSSGFGSLTVSSTRRAVFTLEQGATTVSDGLRWSLSFGNDVRKSRIPKIPSTVVSVAKRTYAGELDGGVSATGFRPALRVGEHLVVIHDGGKCKLPQPGAGAGRVELDAEVTRYSDDREVVRCLELRRPRN